VMTFGIIVGTFSSVFVASPVLLWISQRWGHVREQGTGKRELGAEQSPSRAAAPPAATAT